LGQGAEGRGLDIASNQRADRLAGPRPFFAYLFEICYVPSAERIPFRKTQSASRSTNREVPTATSEAG